MQARSVAANSARATVRVPHQAATMTIVTARNSAVNSIGRAPGEASSRRILDKPSSCATLNANPLKAQPVLHNSFLSPHHDGRSLADMPDIKGQWGGT